MKLNLSRLSVFLWPLVGGFVFAGQSLAQYTDPSSFTTYTDVNVPSGAPGQDDVVFKVPYYDDSGVPTGPTPLLENRITALDFNRIIGLLQGLANDGAVLSLQSGRNLLVEDGIGIGGNAVGNLPLYISAPGEAAFAEFDLAQGSWMSWNYAPMNPFGYLHMGVSTDGLFRIDPEDDMGGDMFVLDSGQGFLGLNTAVPGKTLDVNGEIRSSGDTTVEADLYVTGTIYNDGLGGGDFLGLTAVSYDGSQGGYKATSDICDAEYGPEAGDARVCFATDMITNYIEGVDMAPYTGQVWVNNGPPGDFAPVADCEGWTIADGASYGPVWFFDRGHGSLTECNTSRRFACCSA